MHGIEIYDLWLRTGHGDPLDWIEFMCEAGEIYCIIIKQSILIRKSELYVFS